MTEDVSLLPCAFRYVRLGRTFCLRALDEYDQEVWPQDCAQCPVPPWLAEGICRHLDLGISLGKRARDEPPQALTACRFFGVRLDGLKRCQTCPEFSRWEPQARQNVLSAIERLSRYAPGELIEEALQEILVERGAAETPMMSGCFRAGVNQCLYNPQQNPAWVLVLPPSEQGPAEAYRGLFQELLRAGGREGLFFLGAMEDVDGLCNLCLAIQQAGSVVIDLSQWDAKALFALALGGALARPLLLVREQDSTPPFVPQGIPVFEYTNGESLAVLVVQGLGLQLEQAQVEPEAKPEPAQADEKTPPEGGDKNEGKPAPQE